MIARRLGVSASSDITGTSRLGEAAKTLTDAYAARHQENTSGRPEAMGDDDRTVTCRSRLRGLSLVAVVLATLTLGLAAGYLLRAATEPTAAQPASPSASPAQPDTPAGPPPPASPCIAAAERGEDLLAQLERAIRAIAALDPGTLRTVVDEVELLHEQLQRAVDACGAKGIPRDARPPSATVPSTPG
jgi:hypothetical protein